MGIIRRFLLLTLALCVVLLSAVAQVFAENTINASLGLANCNLAFAELELTLDSAATLEKGTVSLSDGTVLTTFAQPSNMGMSFDDSFGFGMWSPVPYGTVIRLYGLIGQSTPSPDDSVEFLIAYRCGINEVVANCAGTYGTCTEVSIPDVPPCVCLNGQAAQQDERGVLNCGLPLIWCSADSGRDAYWVSRGMTSRLFSLPSAATFAVPSVSP